MRRLLIGAMLFFCSCSSAGVPNGILGSEKMQAVFWDYIRADVYANEYVRQDTTKRVNEESARLQQQVFDLHKVSRKQFYDSYEYYLHHQGKMKPILDTMLVRQQQVTDPKADSVKKIF